MQLLEGTTGIFSYQSSLCMVSKLTLIQRTSSLLKVRLEGPVVMLSMSCGLSAEYCNHIAPLQQTRTC